MSDTLTIQDDQSVPVGLSLQGDNPNTLTIVSASWSTSNGILTPSTDTLTATFVGEPVEDGLTVTISVVATLSDGSTLSTTAEVDVTVSSNPLTLVIVFGTPTGGS